MKALQVEGNKFYQTQKWTILKTAWLNIHSGVHESMQKEELKGVLVKRQIFTQSKASAMGTKYEIHIKVDNST